MAVPGISPQVISQAFLHDSPHTESREADHAYFLVMLHFLNQIHKSIRSSWESVRESRVGHRKRHDETTRSRGIQAQQTEISRREGQRRHVDARMVETEEDTPLHAGRRHLAKRRFHGGGYTQDGHRQLNLPV